MIRKIVGFYRDGFRGMTVGRTLWCIVLLKLLLFGVLRPLFFRDPMAGLSRHSLYPLRQRCRTRGCRALGIVCS